MVPGAKYWSIVGSLRSIPPNQDTHSECTETSELNKIEVISLWIFEELEVF